MQEYNFHPLTVEIKDFFANDKSNDFIKRLSVLIEIERVEVFPDEPDDEEVIVIFKPQNTGLSCIVFTDGIAWLEYIINDWFFDIPFNYELQVENKKNKIQYPKTFGLRYLNSVFEKYSVKGKESLFNDILQLIENISNQKAYFEYIRSWKKIFNRFANFEKCRVYLTPNETIAYSKKWKKEYERSPKLTTIRL